jgi:ribose transport system substrate-binding protein
MIFFHQEFTIFQQFITIFALIKFDIRREKMIPFERQQRIATLLRENPGIKVAVLAKTLSVSEGTIRNDLETMEQAGVLARVRGGAVLLDEGQILNPSFSARINANASAKKRIAKLAAEMVEDGDSILLDASTTVFAMIPHLKKLRDLTVITNGIPIGMALSQNPTHTVILIGGKIGPSGTSVVGSFGSKLLEDIHVKTAFVSCSGFSVEAGLTEIDIHEVEIKRKMIRCAEKVITLVDASKFGKVDLVPFASISQVSHIFTDNKISPDYIDQLRSRCAAVTVCGEDTASSYMPCQENGNYKIGFAGLSEEVPFAVEVRRSIEKAAQEAGNIDLILADNQLNADVALRVADWLIEKGVDLFIEYQIDEKTNSIIMSKLSQAGIPAIAVDIPMVGATFFGVDNYRAGYLAGSALGKQVQREWHGVIDGLIILIEPRAGTVPAARIQGQLDAFQEIVGHTPVSDMLYLNSGNTIAISEAQMLLALESLAGKHRLACICFNDDAAMGAHRAAVKAGREKDLLIVGQGAGREIRKEMSLPHSRIIGATAYWPEKYGPKLLEVAVKLLKGEPVPPAIYNQPVFISKETMEEYYPEPKEAPPPILAKAFDGVQT